MLVGEWQATISQLKRVQHLQLWDNVMSLDIEAAKAAIEAKWPRDVPRREEDDVGMEGIAATRSSVMSKLRWHYLWKLLALLSSPYERTLFIDNDIIAFSPTLVADLLESSLHVSDMTFGRVGHQLEPGSVCCSYSQTPSRHRGPKSAGQDARVSEYGETDELGQEIRARHRDS